MTRTIERLSTVAEKLAPDQQQLLLDIAESMARPGRFYDSLTPSQQAALDEAIVEADSGGGVQRQELEARLDALFSRYGA